MAQTPSNMVELGTKAPPFTLVDTISDQSVSLENLKGKRGTLIMFICNHCPFVIHINDELIRICADYKKKDIAVVAISSNSVKTHPHDGPSYMKTHAASVGYNFPYLFDSDQSVAKAYGAACTPDFFLYDDQLELVYRGQLDSSRPGSGTLVNGKDLRAAIDSMLFGLPVSGIQYPSIGCNIKWDD